LFLFGTGIEAAGTAGVTVSVGGNSVPVKYVGPQGRYLSLDQVNVTIQLTAGGLSANPVPLTIR
jgi:uncharacterized protein (TIGR03437 family)